MYSDIGDNWLIILILTLICSVGYLLLAKHKTLRSFASPLTNPNILVVHGARPGSTVVDPTLFVLKLQTFLRIAKISYVHDYTRPRDRKGRIPWIELNGKEHYDSTLIIEYLTEKFNITIDNQLTRKQKALARTIQKMIEGNTAWVTFVYNRMIEETGWYRKMMRLSWFANCIHKIFFVPWFKKKLYYLGVMDYSLEEVKHIARCDIEALSVILDDKHFFLGDEVTSVDACAFALIANILHGLRKGSWPNEMINNEFPNLIAFYERIKALYWPDWDSIIASVG